MRHEPTDYSIPAAPPPEVLAELDATARALAELDARGSRLTLAMHGDAPALRIAFDDGSETRELTPTQLFDLLT